MDGSGRPLRIATRASRLARWQAERIATLLGGGHELVVVTTEGDRRPDAEIRELAGRGAFTSDVQTAVLDGRADVAVHSAKDLPAQTPPGLVLAAVPERADPRDALVGAALDALPAGGRVATGSVRRRAQLAARRPDLTFAPLRGNIETRLRKAADHDAVVVAVAALGRLGLAAQATEVLDPSVVLPQVAQGALAVECRVDDETTRSRLTQIDDDHVHRAVRAERAYLACLGGGCDLPCGALASVDDDGAVELAVLLASLDGRVVVRATRRGPDADAVGTEAARALLEGAGGAELLDLEPTVPGSTPP